MILKYPSFQHQTNFQQQQLKIAPTKYITEARQQPKNERIDTYKNSFEDDISKQLENQKEILRLKFTYLGDLMMAMDKFENHGDVNDMKEFLLKVHYQYFNNLIEQIYTEKAQLSNQKAKNQELEKQINQEETKQKEKITSNSKAETKKQQQQLAKQLEEEMNNLKAQNNSLITINKQMQEKIQKKDFFREYDFMSKEADGLTKQNEQLKQTIKNQTQ